MFPRECLFPNGKPSPLLSKVSKTRKWHRVSSDATILQSVEFAFSSFCFVRAECFCSLEGAGKARGHSRTNGSHFALFGCYRWIWERRSSRGLTRGQFSYAIQTRFVFHWRESSLADLGRTFQINHFAWQIVRRALNVPANVWWSQGRDNSWEAMVIFVLQRIYARDVSRLIENNCE